MRGENLEVDGLAINALIASRNSRSLIFDFPLDIAKIGEPPVGDVVKLGPFVPSSLSRVPVGGVRVVLALFAWDVDELQNERPPSNDAAATGEEISADDVLEH